MKGSWDRRSGLSVFVLLAIAGSAYATINMTGRWVIVGDVAGSSVINFVQAGTALTQTPPSFGQPGPRGGTIDSTTGAFSVSDQVPCLFGGPPSCTVSGTVAPDGLTFTGTESCQGAGAFACGPFGSAVTGTLSPPTCGNGVVDPGEQCDDGTNPPGGCCDLGCRFVANGTPCGSSNCVHTEGACDGAGTCVPGPPMECDPCSRCDSGSGACVADPAPFCKAPTVAGAARVRVVGNSRQQSWSFKWTRGEATTLADFGDPVHTDGYALCLYGVRGFPTTLLFAAVPPGTKWRAAGSGFTYRDNLGVADGVTTVDLRAGGAGKAKVAFRALGFRPRPPARPLILPLTVQLRGHGECWGASYDQAGVKKNTATEFVAKSSP